MLKFWFNIWNCFPHSHSICIVSLLPDWCKLKVIFNIAPPDKQIFWLTQSRFHQKYLQSKSQRVFGFCLKLTLWSLVWMRFCCLKAAEQLRGDSLLFITKFLGIFDTHLIDLGKWKAELLLEPASGFEPGNPELWILRLNH